MLEQFNQMDSDKLSSEVTRLNRELASLRSSFDELKSKFLSHQHGGKDGTAEIYNEPIVIKPGNYIKGGAISFGDAPKLSIKSGAIKTFNSYHTIDTENEAASDELESIDVKADLKGQVLVLRIRTGTRPITVKDGTGNLRLQQDFFMSSTSDTITLIQGDTYWYELCRSHNFEENGFTILGSEEELTIASGSVTPTSGFHQIDTEGNAATDDLDTIVGTNVPDGALLVIEAASSTRTVVCKDGTGNLRLAGDFSLTDTDDKLTLLWTGTQWHELSRSDNAV